MRAVWTWCQPASNDSSESIATDRFKILIDLRSIKGGYGHSFGCSGPLPMAPEEGAEPQASPEQSEANPLAEVALIALGSL